MPIPDLWGIWGIYSGCYSSDLWVADGFYLESHFGSSLFACCIHVYTENCVSDSFLPLCWVWNFIWLEVTRFEFSKFRMLLKEDLRVFILWGSFVYFLSSRLFSVITLGRSCAFSFWITDLTLAVLMFCCDLNLFRVLDWFAGLLIWLI